MTDEATEKSFCIDRAKQGRAACKICKSKCLVGELRIAKFAANPFGEGKMKNWHHIDCIFQQFLKQRVTTKRIESFHDIDGWNQLNEIDKTEVIKKIEESEKIIAEKYGLKTPSRKYNINKASTSQKKGSTTSFEDAISSLNNETTTRQQYQDLYFREFRRLVAEISNVSSYIEKTKIVKKFFQSGSDGIKFKGDLIQWCRLLLPGVVIRVYNLQSKQLIKLFSKIFHVDQDTMLEHLKSGDIGETIQEFFQQNRKCKPIKKSTLTVQRVDSFLEQLTRLTKEDEQISHFESIISQCTGNDLKIIIRLIKHDLRMNAGAKHILDAVHPDAYTAYQASRDLSAVIKRCLSCPKTALNADGRVKAAISVMTPVQPMLAEACKSVDQAMNKCPNGMFAEIKYDGERVQVHKEGSGFKYFTRNLKPVLPHKVTHFKDYIPKAFPHATDLILDSEILMIDTITGKPLPFGSLGVHKKSQFQDANVCLFVFDCIFYNGESLVNKSLQYRKKILKENMIEIPNHIMFSELKIITEKSQLSSMISKVLQMGLEGLVLKDVESIYEPGKRHWLKVKKDYLHDGAMADTADLIVLGAWYGTGRKAGMKSVFLMGCYDRDNEKFCTVTKVHTGHDDKALEKLQDELKMTKIHADISKVPSWLNCTRTMIPDFVAVDPKQQPVWEITGAEFTQHDVHTAHGISIRFPRVTMVRNDKDWTTATNLQELKNLFLTSKQSSDFASFMDVEKNDLQHRQGYKRKREHSELETLTSDDQSLKNDAINVRTKNIEIVNPLIDIFKNVKLLVQMSGKKEFADWLRYFVAYGGDIVKSNQWSLATHVLHMKKSTLEQNVISIKDARHVNIKWIKDSIVNQQLQDIRPYSVTWNCIDN